MDFWPTPTQTLNVDCTSSDGNEVCCHYLAQACGEALRAGF